MKKKGISLVALVITIIVLIILTGAVIMTFMEGGIIEKAKYSVAKSDYTTLVEAYGVNYGKEKIEVETDPNKEELNKIAVLSETVEDLGIEGFTFNEDKTDVDYSGDNEDIKNWIIANFKYQELAGTGFYVSEVDGEAYLTGIKMSGKEVITTVADLLNALPKDEYRIIKGFYNQQDEDVTDNVDMIVTTGYKIVKNSDGSVYATIVVKGNVDPDTIVTSNDADYIAFAAQGGSKLGKENFLAMDINNDGIVSPDDYDLLMYAYTGGPIDISGMQNVVMTKTPTTSSESLGIYKFYTEVDIINLLTTGENAYKIERTGAGAYKNVITVATGTTYQELENGLNSKLGVSGVVLNVEDKTAVMESEAKFKATIPLIFGENKYSKVSSIGIRIVLE